MARRTQLSIESRSEPWGVVLALRGELDMATVPQMERELAQAAKGGPATIVLDLRELDFIDSTGLRTLLAEHERSRESGRELALVRGSRQVDRLMTITRVADHLRIVSSPEEILA